MISRTADNASIQSVYIEKLFGCITYEISQSNGTDFTRLLALYGDNGGGKTTILNLLYHLFNDDYSAGHRTYISTIPFRQLSVVLSNGSRVTVGRKGRSIIDGYVLTATPPTGSEIRWDFSRNPSPTDYDESGYQAFIRFLLEFGPVITYLSDARQNILHSPHVDVGRPEAEQATLFPEHDRRKSLHVSKDTVLVSMREATNWFRNRAYRASSEGTHSVYLIYDALVRNLLRKGGHHVDETPRTGPSLIEHLSQLREQYAEYAEFELVQAVDIDRMIKGIMNATETQLPLIDSLLQPFIQGEAARLKALHELKTVLNSTQDALSELLGGKTVTVNPKVGFNIVSNFDGMPIRPQSLSSGERHLLIMICHAILARDPNSILIIDEPEISLNIKWLRRLLDVLLSLLRGSNSQLVIASHSIDLLMDYDEHVVHLISAVPAKRRQRVKGK